MINRSIKEGSDEELYALTKLYALLYSSYAEVSFLKLIHTLRTHYRDYYLRIEELEQYIDKTKNWNLESRRQKMRESMWDNDSTYRGEADGTNFFFGSPISPLTGDEDELCLIRNLIKSGR